MSFYQPSLSLYDVLNALGNQPPARDPGEQLFGTQGYYPQPPAYRPSGYGARARLPTGLVYRLPEDTCYYRPNYYYTGEDDDEAEDAVAQEEELEKEEEELEEEEEEEEEEEQRAQRAQQASTYDQLPSYYHSRAPKGGVQDSYEESDPVRELLSALVGDIPSYGTPSFRQAPPQPPVRGSIGGGDDLVKQAMLEKLTQDFQEAGSERKPRGAEIEGKPAEQATKPKEKLPFPLNKKPSFASAPTHSSTTEPLQVSKPEARLDLPFSPEVNVYDCPEQYLVAVALPGATSKAFKVDYHPSTHELILKGDVEDKLGISEDYLKVTELKYGAFQRTIKFPIIPRIKDEEIKASYKNGLLQVKVPKIAESSKQPIPKKRIVIEDVPDEELEYEEHPALAL